MKKRIERSVTCDHHRGGYSVAVNTLVFPHEHLYAPFIKTIETKSHSQYFKKTQTKKPLTKLAVNLKKKEVLFTYCQIKLWECRFHFAECINGFKKQREKFIEGQAVEK